MTLRNTTGHDETSRFDAGSDGFSPLSRDVPDYSFQNAVPMVVVAHSDSTQPMACFERHWCGSRQLFHRNIRVRNTSHFTLMDRPEFSEFFLVPKSVHVKHNFEISKTNVSSTTQRQTMCTPEFDFLHRHPVALLVKWEQTATITPSSTSLGTQNSSLAKIAF